MLEISKSESLHPGNKGYVHTLHTAGGTVERRRPCLTATQIQMVTVTYPVAFVNKKIQILLKSNFLKFHSFIENGMHIEIQYL